LPKTSTTDFCRILLRDATVIFRPPGGATDRTHSQLPARIELSKSRHRHERTGTALKCRVSLAPCPTQPRPPWVLIQSYTPTSSISACGMDALLMQMARCLHDTGHSHMVKRHTVTKSQSVHANVLASRRPPPCSSWSASSASAHEGPKKAPWELTATQSPAWPLQTCGRGRARHSCCLHGRRSGRARLRPRPLHPSTPSRWGGGGKW
jgi:hypothetical protein